MSQTEAQSSKVFIRQVLEDGSRARVQEGSKVWIQGVLAAVSPGPRETTYHIDDGTGVISAVVKEAARKRTLAPGTDYGPGTYLLVIGKVKRPGGRSNVLVHNLIDLSESPDREAAWSLQVVTAQSISAPPPGAHHQQQQQQGHHPRSTGVQ